MRIYAKIGTGPLERVHVYRKRKSPVVGEFINVVRLPTDGTAPRLSSRRRHSCRVTEIKDTGYETVFYLERF